LDKLQVQYESAVDQCLDELDNKQLNELASKREDFNNHWCDLSSWIQDEISRRSPPPSNVAQPSVQTDGLLNEKSTEVESNRVIHKLSFTQNKLFKLQDKFSNALVVHLMVSRLYKQTLKEWKSRQRMDAQPTRRFTGFF
jgi:hypothetical protein